MAPSAEFNRTEMETALTAAAALHPSDKVRWVVPQESPSGQRTSAMAGFLRLTFSNYGLLAVSLITGPLQARVLGVDGRGQVAAIFGPLILFPYIFDVGLQNYVARARARGASVTDLAGTFLPISALIGLTSSSLAFVLPQWIAHGRHTVSAWLTVGLLMLPFTLVFQTLGGLPWGEENWHLMARMKWVGTLTPALALVVLALIGHLNVATAAGALLLGGPASWLLLLRYLRQMHQPHLDTFLAKQGLSYGAKVWLGTLSMLTIAQLDQFLMAPLVSSRQLGLYAVAVTLAAATSGLVGAVGTMVVPRAVRDESESIARACRITITVVVAGSAVIAGAAPFLLPALFGRSFAPAVPMTWILLGANAPATLVSVLGGAFSASDVPGKASRGLLLGAAITIPALILFVRSTGGIGAAVITLVSVSVVATYYLFAGRRYLDMKPRDCVFVQRKDLKVIAARLSDLKGSRQSP